MRPVAVVPLILLLLSLPVAIASAQVPARVAPPYTLMDDESPDVSSRAGSRCP